jgi:hypothetical protein
MPARTMADSSDGMGATLLRRHKVLPHPRPEWPSTDSQASASKPQTLTIDTDFPLWQRKVDGPRVLPSLRGAPSTSPHTLKHTSRKIGGAAFPPTPPTHSRQSSGASSVATPQQNVVTPDVRRSPETPPNQKSPPTPDVTPPRARRPIALRPPASDRYASSRTDSFKTARETPYVSEEDESAMLRPAISFTRPPVPQPPRKPREIGLGLGLESDTESATTPRGRKGPADFGTFDGEWDSVGEGSEVEREWDDNLMRNVMVRKRRDGPSKPLTRSDAGEIVKDHPISPSKAVQALQGQTLQDKVVKNRRDRHLPSHTATEKAVRKQPAVTGGTESPTPPGKRSSLLSAMSGSTIVEVMVVDRGPQRQRTLRHTKKQLELRHFSSESSGIVSKSSSAGSVPGTSRLGRNNSKITERDQARSSRTASTSSIARARKDLLSSGYIPVVVVPERRSSSKTARTPSLRSTNSRQTKRSASMSSAPPSHSSKSNAEGYFDLAKPRGRTLSESAGSQRTLDFAPQIPTRRSSLSAPTSRNTSRAGSLTAESLKAHNLLQRNGANMMAPMGTTFENARCHDAFGAGKLEEQAGDALTGNRLSEQLTPFSQVSYATTGTSAEVNEAMAVTMHPQEKESISIVDHRSDEESSSNKVKASEMSEEVVTPTRPTQPDMEVDSPLKNPREAPKPPAIKVILATPAAMSPSQEVTRQLGFDSEERSPAASDKPSRSMSLVRRALSDRRRSESFMSLKRTFSRKGAGNDPTPSTVVGNAQFPSVVDQPADASKLHPFWQPAQFWNDLENDEEGIGPYDDDPYSPDAAEPRSLKRGFSMKRTFAILPIKEDHQPIERRTIRRTGSGNLRQVRRYGSNQSLRQAKAERLYSTRPQRIEGPHTHTIPGLGLKWEYVGITGLKRRFSEKKLERRREALRRNISGPQQTIHGDDQVLGSRMGIMV